MRSDWLDITCPESGWIVMASGWITMNVMFLVLRTAQMFTSCLASHKCAQAGSWKCSVESRRFPKGVASNSLNDVSGCVGSHVLSIPSRERSQVTVRGVGGRREGGRSSSKAVFSASS